ncbi:MAG: cohesin domain-containing protein [Acutalibacteraceae bacterium]
MKYKKLIAAVLFLLLSLSMIISSFAANTAVVYALDTNANAGKVVFIPIQIKDNPGLMGFRLTITYDPETFSPRLVSRGSLTESGALEDSIGTSEEASFDIVWNDTKQTDKDGTVAVVGFDCSSKASGSAQISIRYAPEDTFNEKYEDVSIDCRSVNISFEGNAETAAPEDKRDITPEDIVLAVETVQGDPQMEPTQAVMDAVNAVLTQLTGQKEPYYNSPEEITPSYIESVKETFTQDVLDSVEASQAMEIVQNALDTVEAESPDAVQEDRKIDFISNVEAALEAKAPDIKTLSDYIKTDDEIAVISDLLEGAKKEAESNKNVSEKLAASFNENSLFPIAVICLAVVIAAVSVCTVIRKNRKKSRKSKSVDNINEKK